MKCIRASIILVISLLICFPTIYSSGDVPEIRPLVAYSARTIPTIDGIVSIGEWNDTVTYEYIRNNTELNDVPITLNCALKHDDNWLYILFIVNVVLSDCEITILSVPENDIDLIAEHALVILTNGTVKNAQLHRTGIATNWASMPDVIASTSILNNEYIAEMKFNKTIFNITYNFSPFNIEYTHIYYSTDTVAIGRIRSTEPGLILSSNYYEETYNKNNLDLILWMPIIIVLIAVPISVVYILHRKRKNPVNEAVELKPKEPEREKIES